MTPFLRLMVIRKILLINDGRDKVLKVIQYGAKAVLWLQLIEHISALASNLKTKLPPSQARMLDLLLDSSVSDPNDKEKKPKRQSTQSRLQKLIPHLSMARKIVRLFHFLEPFNELCEFNYSDLHPSSSTLTRSQFRLHWISLVAHIAGIVNDVSDDAIAFSKMGILEKSWATWCTPISDRLWMLSIFIDVHEISVGWIGLSGRLRELNRRLKAVGGGSEKDSAERQGFLIEKQKIMQKLHVYRLSLIKLSADFVFCFYDVAGLGDRGGWNEGWQVFSGLTAACFGTWKLFVKHK
ncbi:hypothetical protein HDU76_009071 [Blyttiomyces sp. JEL0837]|nr:hypothetical protein HDU76_009071 [Blyttiomyces sp. JEL0837]